MAGAPAPTWPRSPVSVWLRRGAPGKVLWGGGWASPPGAVSNRKLLSFSFLLGFFSFKGAEVPRGLHQDKHGGFLLCSSLSSSLLSHRPLPPCLSWALLFLLLPLPPGWLPRVLPCLVCGHCWAGWPHRPAPVLGTVVDGNASHPALALGPCGPPRGMRVAWPLSPECAFLKSAER